MKLSILMPLALLFLVVVSGAESITGGKETVIIGQAKSEGTPPADLSIYNYNIIEDPISAYRDPGQYSSVPVDVRQFIEDRDKDKERTPIDINRSMKNPGVVFQMSGEVLGVGSFSEYRSLDGGTDLKSKRISSSGLGNLSVADDLTLMRETLTDRKFGLILSNKEAFFFGRSYREQDSYRNDQDFLRNSLVSGTILKESNYVGVFEEGVYSQDNGTAYNLTDRFSRYTLNTRFVGSYDLLATSNNGTEMREQYIGQIAINSNMESRKTIFEEKIDSQWLSCYSEEPEVGEECLI